MILMSVDRISSVTNTQPYFTQSLPDGCSSVVCDSRSVEDGSLFVALEGARVDGHSFVPEIVSRPDRLALVSRTWFGEHQSELVFADRSAIFVVDDPLASLQALAYVYIREFKNLWKVGITGSYGKTTTKEMVGAIMSQSRSVVINEGNLNSEIGLPLSVFKIRKEHKIAVFEMGMDHVGEIELLTDIIHPEISVITNIGTAHIGMLGSQEVIAREKKMIFSRFSGVETAVIPFDDPYREFLSSHKGARTVLFGPGSGPILNSRDAGLSGQILVFQDGEITLALPGKYHYRNALAAVAVCEILGASEIEMKAGLSQVKALPGRGEILQGRVTILQDSYNANPDSMKETLEYFSTVPDLSGRRVVVLGDMLERGEQGPGEHRDLGRLAAESSIDHFFFFGPAMKVAYAECSDHGGSAVWTDNFEELKDHVSRFVCEGDAVLVKGSRRMALERLVSVLLPEIPG